MKNTKDEGQIRREYEVIRPTEKQCLNHHLLHTVKQINGDLAFKQVCQRSVVIRFHQKMQLPDHYSSDYFCYILQGEVAVYKTLRNKQDTNSNQGAKKSQLNYVKGIFITSHKTHQIFGLQEYPLNISEKLMFEANEITKIMVFPLELSLTCFKRIFNMNMVQFRAQAMKRCEFFREFEIEKLKKIALQSKRYNGLKGQILIKEGCALNYLILVLSGEICSLKNDEQKQLFRNDSLIGLNQVIDSNELFPYDLVCITQSEFMLIPKDLVIKSYKIRYRLEEKQSVIKSGRRIKQEPEREKYSSLNLKPKESINTFGMNNDTAERPGGHKKIRPNTSINKRENPSVKDVKYSTFYNQRKQSFVPKRHKTEVSQKSEKSQSLRLKTEYRRNEDLGGLKYQSLGEMCLKKFIYRKERRENCEIIKYLKSNAPELKLNPHKQYALVKPLQVQDSSYIRSWKRKLKKSYLKTGGPQERQKKLKEAKFSLFFKEDQEDQEDQDDS